MRRVPLHWQIFIALGAAFAVGLLIQRADDAVSLLGVPLIDIFDFIGQLFLRALRMLIVPLIAAAIVTGVAGLGSEHAFARLGTKTILYFLATGFIATLIGLALVNWTQPGIVDGRPVALHLTPDPGELQKRVGERGARDVVNVFLRAVPDNVVATASNNSDILALIVFSILFGYFLGRTDSEPARVLKLFWQGVYDIMIRITGLVMVVAPVGIFALVARTVATTDVKELGSLIVLFFSVLAGLALHLFVVLPLLLWTLGGVNPLRQFRAMMPALLTAFSTSSSSATLPLTLECIQKRAGVSNRISSFVVPLGATVNMNGTALYECVAAIFIAQASGIQLSFGTQLVVVLLALVTSIGVAGVPSASLVAIVVILGAIGLPLEGIGLILVVDRILDMCRTAVNVFSDACGAVIIARSEGETAVLAGPAAPE